MICPKCGSQLDADNKFCGKCGATIQKEPVSYPLSEGIPKQGSLLKKRKMIILTAAALLVIIAIIVIVSVYVQPSAQINRAISSGDIASAYVLYTAKCSGEPLEDSTLEALVQYAEDVVSRYENGEIPYGEAVEQLDALTSFAILSQELSSLQSSLLQEMSEKNSVAVNIADGHTASQSGDYLNAIQCYQRALNLDAESEEAQQGLSEAVDQYRNEVLAQVEEYSASGDFSAAESALTIALDYLPEDEVLTEQLNGLDDLKIQTIVHEAYAAADGGDWDGAIGILQEAQTVYTSSQEINEAYEDILEEMPITLENITIVSSDEIEIYNEVVKDRWGNIYDDGVRIEGSTDGYILVALNQNFTKFTGTAFVVDSASIGKNMWFSVYLDEKLVYYTDGITEESQPISLEIDITGATTMRISVGNEGSFSNGGLIFGNTHFEKVPKSKETDEGGQASYSSCRPAVCLGRYRPRVAVRKAANHTYAAADLLVQPFYHIMDGTPLVLDLRKHVFHSLQHAKTPVANNEFYTIQTTAAEPLEEADPVGLVLLHALSGVQSLTVSAITDCNRHQNSHIFKLSAQVAAQVDPIHLDTRIESAL